MRIHQYRNLDRYSVLQKKVEYCTAVYIVASILLAWWPWPSLLFHACTMPCLQGIPLCPIESILLRITLKNICTLINNSTIINNTVLSVELELLQRRSQGLSFCLERSWVRGWSYFCCN
jgi:hypothetical protein